MFGCTAIYVADKIMLILRDRPDETADNGVWLATTAQHHEPAPRVPEHAVAQGIR